MVGDDGNGKWAGAVEIICEQLTFVYHAIDSVSFQSGGLSRMLYVNNDQG